MLIGIFILLLLLLCGIVVYFYLYYPQQMLPVGEQVSVTTIQPEKYHHDCLHPCIRYSEQGFAGYHYWMVQSPYYAWNNKVENPIVYHANELALIGANGGGAGE